MSTVDRRSSTRAVLAVLAIPLVLAVVFIAVTIARAASASVTIENLAFSPGTISVTAGDTVTWTNKDAVPHTVTSDTGAFDSPIGIGGVLTLKFPTPGTFAYSCTIHPQMHGTVIVAAAAAGSNPSNGAAPAQGSPSGGAGTTASAPAAGSGVAPGIDYTPLFVLLGGLFVAVGIGSALIAAQAAERH
jgi:plastocyanin